MRGVATGSAGRDGTATDRSSTAEIAGHDGTAADRSAPARQEGTAADRSSSARLEGTAADRSSSARPEGTAADRSSTPAPRGETEPATWADLAKATTSRPSPERFASYYAALAERGVAGVVSIHLSGELSGTVEAARAAAREAPIPVTVVDSRSIGMGLGFPVLAAAHAAEAGGTPEQVAEAAVRCAARTRTFFYVDTLDHLRRGGRIGTAASLVGTALMIKPLLHLTDGHIALLEKVRTASRALARLEDLAVREAGDDPVEIAVQHLAAPDRAEVLADNLAKRIPGAAGVRVVEVGAVIGVHVGPGTLGITLSPSP
ncbi:DegV family protein [Nonomuraea sp. NPDC048826]|uniref:DegV family protein n=1 Tax=Nonomuraea sp. NPDC048826 TaxID=3364347 RepID=UPI00371FDF49